MRQRRRYTHSLETSQETNGINEMDQTTWIYENLEDANAKSKAIP